MHTDTYSQTSSKRRSRMKIDSLLNPPADDCEYSTTASSPYTQHTRMSSTSSNTGYTYSPGYSTSPTQYWYGRYQDYHDTSPGAASTATTHFSNASNASTTSLGSSNSLNSQSHHHQMFHSYRPSKSQSTRCSPDAYPSRERYGSVSSSSSTNGTDRRRPPRPKYEEEEMYFIWYHRVDLCQEWKEVRESFNRQFPNRQRRGFQGIQCKFYRFIKEKKCPTLREQRRMRDGEFLREGAALGPDSGAPRFGVVEWAHVWYPWMREDRDTAMRRRIAH